MLRVRPGAALTVIGWTFGVLDCGTEFVTLAPAGPDGALAAFGLLAGLVEPAWVEAAGVLLPPPPPQPVSTAQVRNRARR
ncbi:hypothetical protein [Paraburkholderia madseniana]|uniref:hypothetical protein n=1 Tax=Paraburkholderia madseniana TaxID=2599607 RepID=UPI001F24884C|nr:hypothetical protein [Paraburkholderia madseniana]